jgi:hypothetical protein
MKRNFQVFIGLLVVLLAVLACNGEEDGPLPTITLDRPAVPTPTLMPTYTPTLPFDLTFGERQVIQGGGFSFQPILEYMNDVQDMEIAVSDPAHVILISVYGDTAYSGPLSADAIIDTFFGSVEGGEYIKGPSYPFSIDNIPGTAVDVTATLYDMPYEGQAVLIMPGDAQFLFALGMANLGLDPDLWVNEGRPVFHALLSTIQFVGNP